jgi:hypothetical protein
MLYLIIKTIEAKSIDEARRKEKTAELIYIAQKTFTPPPLDSIIGTPLTDHEALRELGLHTKTKKRK